MDAVKQDFVSATERASKAGFDMVEFHAAHGYLMSSFISPLTNQRQDEYGGTTEARCRYPLEVFRAMRAVWPTERPMSVRISATDWVPGGMTPDEASVVAGLFRDAGADIVHVSAGQVSKDEKPVYGRMFQVPFSDQIRNEAKVPTIAVGNIFEADHVNTIIAAGRADLCALARPHLDPACSGRARVCRHRLAAPLCRRQDAARAQPRACRATGAGGVNVLAHAPFGAGLAQPPAPVSHPSPIALLEIRT
jgi:anthraniloyl-CoA monooxygenase